MENKKVVLITGASSGIGKETASYFANKGYIVYGIARKDFNIENVKTILCDVKIKEDLKKAVEFIILQTGKIDILINNAGMGISGSAEFSDSEQIKNMFDINFMGAVNLTQIVLKHMRQNGGGTIINTSSVGGFIPLPYQSYYSATKAALDVWAKALRIELKPYKIKVCNIQPGDIKTDFTGSRQKSINDKEKVYEVREQKSVQRMEKDEQNGMKPIKIAKAIFKLSKCKNPPVTKTVGGMYKLIKFLSRIVPEKLLLFVVGKLYG